jgi:hypothetical protein
LEPYRRVRGPVRPAPIASQPNPDGHRYRNGHGNSDSHRYCNGFCDSHCHGNRHRHVNANTDCGADT